MKNEEDACVSYKHDLFIRGAPRGVIESIWICGRDLLVYPLLRQGTYDVTCALYSNIRAIGIFLLVGQVQSPISSFCEFAENQNYFISSMLLLDSQVNQKVMCSLILQGQSCPIISLGSLPKVLSLTSAYNDLVYLERR